MPEDHIDFAIRVEYMTLYWELKNRFADTAALVSYMDCQVHSSWVFHLFEYNYGLIDPKDYSSVYCKQ